MQAGIARTRGTVVRASSICGDMCDDGAVVEEFEPWLAQVLRNRCSEHAEADVFCTYIASLLEDNSDESTDEKIDALHDILSEICTVSIPNMTLH